MIDADIIRQPFLEFADLRPENVAAFGHDVVDGGLQTVDNAVALGAEIDELHGT